MSGPEDGAPDRSVNRRPPRPQPPGEEAPAAGAWFRQRRRGRRESTAGDSWREGQRMIEEIEGERTRADRRQRPSVRRQTGLHAYETKGWQDPHPKSVYAYLLRNPVYFKVTSRKEDTEIRKRTLVVARIGQGRRASRTLKAAEHQRPMFIQLGHPRTEGQPRLRSPGSDTASVRPSPPNE